MADNGAPMTEAMFYILLALWDHSCHGYAIMQRISQLSAGRITMGPGTLYGVLTRMDKDGWILLQEESGPLREGGRHRKVYCITQAGESALRQEYRRLQCMVEDGAILRQLSEKGQVQEEE